MKIITVLLTNHFAALHAAGLIFLIVAFQVAVARLELQREAKRRWQHALTGQALVLISYFLPIAVALPALLVGAFGIWYCRLYLSDIYFRAFGPLLRPNERLGATLPGAFYFLVGTFLAVLLFPLPVARYAVLCLSWADPMAAWIGQTIPILSIHRSASLGGCCACLITATLIGYVSFPDKHYYSRIFSGAIGCAVAEALPLGNDNLLIPLLTGYAFQSAPFSR